jgi:hypothetical protein
MAESGGGGVSGRRLQEMSQADLVKMAQKQLLLLKRTRDGKTQGKREKEKERRRRRRREGKRVCV